MNIGILAQKPEKNIDGINRVTIELMKEILKLDHHNQYSFIGNTDWLNVPMPYVDIIPDSRNIMKLNYVVQAKPYNIIHSHYKPFEFNSHLGCAKILTIHDLLVLKNKEKRYGPVEFFDVALRQCAKEADCIIAVSEYTKKDIIECYGVNPDKIKVVYNGVYTTNHIEEGTISGKISELSHTNYIVAVSTMREYKNTHGLVRAFRLFKDRHPYSDLKLVLVGKNDKSTSVGEQIKECMNGRDDIIFTGYISDQELTYLYRHSLASAFVSLYEGFGLPVLESLSFGKTVICSNQTSLPEIGGDAVEYCNPYEIESMEDAMEKVILNDSHRYSLEQKACLQAQKFSYEKAAKEVVKIYQMFDES